MENPKRFVIKTDSFGEGLYSEEDPKGPWIHDPDHKIDVSKFCESENEQGKFTRPDNTEAALCPDCGKPHCKDYSHLRYKPGG